MKTDFIPRIAARWLGLAGAALSLLALSACTREKLRADGGRQEMIVWHVEPTPAARATLDEIARKVEASHPGLKVLVESKPWLTLGSELASAIAQKRTPDLAMVEPYMMAALVAQKQIEPLDSLYDEIGREDFYPFLREINTFDGRLYGLPHAYGVGYFSYRADLLKQAGGATPRTFPELIQTAERLRQYFPAPVLLCGGTDFLLDQLFVSLVASNGGRMFDPLTHRPLFDSAAVIEALTWFDRLAQFAPPDWKTRSYADTFVTFAKGQGALVPLTAARTINQIAQDAAPELADPQHFAVFHTPVGPSGSDSFNFIDAEPWVVFSASSNKKAARAFLVEFYRDETYLKFCLSVPLHLTPSRRSLQERYFAAPFLTKWRPWVDLQIQLIDQRKVLPLMSSSVDEHRLPFLWEVYQARIVTEMLAGTGAPAERAKAAQAKAERLIEERGYRQW